MKALIIFLFLLTSCATTNLGPEEKALPEGESKFCFVGDMGLASGVQEQVSLLLEKENCHSLHFVGDLIYPSGIKSVKDRQLQSHFHKYYKALKGPIQLILGNHDHRGTPEAWLELAKKDPRYVFPHYYYLQNWGGLCLTHLDTNFYKLFKDYFKGEVQKGWLEKHADYLNQNCTTTVALTHHPYLSRGTKHGNAKGLVKFFHEKHIIGRFDYLISGHEHILSDEGERKGTRLFITGAGGNFTKGEDAGYLVFNVNAKEGKITNITHEWRRISTK
jgi:predicted phosphodiesterase